MNKFWISAHQEALKKEIERLRQIYHQQSIHKMGNSNNNNGPSLQSTQTSQPQQQNSNFHQHLGCKDKEQLLS